jgi:hypothetical protein
METQLHCEEAVYWFAFKNPWGGAVYSFRGEQIEEEKRRMRNEVATKQGDTMKKQQASTLRATRHRLR